MSYSIDANLLLYASNTGCAEHAAALDFMQRRVADPDLCCLAWSTLFAYLRISTHPSIFRRPLAPEAAWTNVRALMRLPRVRIITEDQDFADHYELLTRAPSYAATWCRMPISPHSSINTASLASTPTTRISGNFLSSKSLAWKAQWRRLDRINKINGMVRSPLSVVRSPFSVFSPSPISHLPSPISHLPSPISHLHP